MLDIMVITFLFKITTINTMSTIIPITIAISVVTRLLLLITGIITNSTTNVIPDVVTIMIFAGKKNVTANATTATTARLLTYRSMVRREHIKPHVRVRKIN